MKIAYLVSQYPAPSHTFIRREIAALRALGVDVRTYSIRRGECLSELDREEERRTFYVLESLPRRAPAAHLASLCAHPRRWAGTFGATLGHRLPGAKPFVKASAYFIEALTLARELRAHGITHLHNHFGNSGAHVGLAAARFLGIGWSATLHGEEDWGGANAPLLREKVAAARFVASATQYGVEQAKRIIDPCDWAKLHVVRCGIEPDALPVPHRRQPGPGEPLQLLTVARLSPEKAIPGLVEAFARSVRSGVDARLTIVGGGPEEARVRAAVAAHGVAERVVLRGRQPEAAVLDEMTRAHAFVLSSLTEGLPVVLMEAMALGLPVVAPAITGIPELVRHRETGLLFSRGRWDELAQQLSIVATDAELRERMAASARARLLPEFDVRHSAKALSELFARAHGAPGLAGAPRAALASTMSAA